MSSPDDIALLPSKDVATEADLDSSDSDHSNSQDNQDLEQPKLVIEIHQEDVDEDENEDEEENNQLDPDVVNMAQPGGNNDINQTIATALDGLATRLAGILTPPDVTPPVVHMGRKETSPPILTEIDPVQYATFKKCFTNTARLNQWDDKISVLKLSVSIRDQAARTIDHLKFENIATLAIAFKKIEDVILNPAGIEFFKATFNQSSRNHQETLIQWHTRAREMYARAYPDHIAEIETKAELKDKFVLAIKDKLLSTQLKASDNYETWTYTDILTKAQRIHGSTLIVHQAYSGRSLPSDGIHSIELLSTKESPAINALQAHKKKRPQCFHCGREGHMVNDCSLNQKTIDRIRADPGRYNLQPINSHVFRGSSYPRGRGSFRGWRPSFRGRPSGGGRFRRFRGGKSSFTSKRPQINSLEAQEYEDPYAPLTDHQHDEISGEENEMEKPDEPTEN